MTLQDDANKWAEQLKQSRTPAQVEIEDGRIVAQISGNTGITVNPPPDMASGRLEVRLKKGQRAISTDSWPTNTVFRLNGASLEFRGPATIPSANFVGTGSVVFQAGVDLIDPSFEGESPVNIKAGGNIVNGKGTAHLSLSNPQSIVQGHPREGLRLKSFSRGSIGNQPAGELENVDIFALPFHSYGVLEQTSRLKPWMPPGAMGGVNRKECLRSAIAMDMGTPDETSQRNRKQFFWAHISETMKRQGVGGRIGAAVREIGFETRRLASARFSAEWWLLGIAKAFGYGTRIGRPILLWAGGALLATLLLGLESGCLAAGACQGVSLGALFLDVFLSPVTFIRSNGVRTALTTLLELGAGERLTTVIMQGFGALAIVFTAFAIRHHTRLS